MEKEHFIKPLNDNIKIEENPSFSNETTQERARSVYPVETRSTIHVEEAIREQTAEVRKIRAKLSWVVLLLAIPYVVSLVFLALIALTGFSLQQSFNRQNSSSYIQSN